MSKVHPEDYAPSITAVQSGQLQKAERYTAKADMLLKQGDAIGGAAGRRMLRDCRRYRRLAHAAISKAAGGG